MRYREETDFIIREELPVLAIQAIEVEILRAFVAFCEEHGLRYFLAGGTLIGAVRHGGFVPWDDDMDVSMPRPDFERFRELTADGRLGQYTIRSIIHSPELHARPFDRLVDTRYMAKVKADQPFIPPWLDIHALDGLPEDDVENHRHWSAVGRLKRSSLLTRTAVNLRKKGGLRRAARAVYHFREHLKGPIYYAWEMHTLAKKYAFDTAEYVASFMAGYGRKERMPRYYFTDGEKKLYFEGILCSVPPHYDLVLRHMYGNYLQIPPVSARVTHVEKLWAVVTEEEKETTNV